MKYLLTLDRVVNNFVCTTNTFLFFLIFTMPPTDVVPVCNIYIYI